jgi:hypothetical protein
MSDYLSNLAAKTLGLTTVVQPLLSSLFEPSRAALRPPAEPFDDGELELSLDESSYETIATGPRRRTQKRRSTSIPEAPDTEESDDQSPTVRREWRDGLSLSARQFSDLPLASATFDSRPPTIDSRQRTFNLRQPTIDSRQPAVDSEELDTRTTSASGNGPLQGQGLSELPGTVYRQGDNLTSRRAAIEENQPERIAVQIQPERQRPAALREDERAALSGPLVPRDEPGRIVPQNIAERSTQGSGADGLDDSDRLASSAGPSSSATIVPESVALIVTERVGEGPTSSPSASRYLERRPIASAALSVPGPLTAQPSVRSYLKPITSAAAIEQAAEPQSPPTIQVTIGRVEVRATSQPAPAAKQKAAPPVMSLDQYLSQRTRGGNR